MTDITYYEVHDYHGLWAKCATFNEALAAANSRNNDLRDPLSPFTKIIRVERTEILFKPHEKTIRV